MVDLSFFPVLCLLAFGDTALKPLCFVYWALWHRKRGKMTLVVLFYTHLCAIKPLNINILVGISWDWAGAKNFAGVLCSAHVLVAKENTQTRSPGKSRDNPRNSCSMFCCLLFCAPLTYANMTNQACFTSHKYVRTWGSGSVR